MYECISTYSHQSSSGSSPVPFKNVSGNLVLNGEGAGLPLAFAVTLLQTARAQIPICAPILALDPI